MIEVERLIACVIPGTGQRDSRNTKPQEQEQPCMRAKGQTLALGKSLCCFDGSVSLRVGPCKWGVMVDLRAQLQGPDKVVCSDGLAVLAFALDECALDKRSQPWVPARVSSWKTERGCEHICTNQANNAHRAYHGQMCDELREACLHESLAACRQFAALEQRFPHDAVHAADRYHLAPWRGHATLAFDCRWSEVALQRCVLFTLTPCAVSQHAH